MKIPIEVHETLPCVVHDIRAWEAPDLPRPYTRRHYKERERAAKLCADCPIRQQCYDAAMGYEMKSEARQRAMIWGGTTPLDRYLDARGYPRTSDQPLPENQQQQTLAAGTPCKGCGALLATETQMRNHPYLRETHFRHQGRGFCRSCYNQQRTDRNAAGTKATPQVKTGTPCKKCGKPMSTPKQLEFTPGLAETHVRHWGRGYCDKCFFRATGGSRTPSPPRNFITLGDPCKHCEQPLVTVTQLRKRPELRETHVLHRGRHLCRRCYQRAKSAGEFE